MRDFFKFLPLLMVALIGVTSAQATNTLTVYQDGDEPNWTVPINLLYLDEAGTRSQVIYPAEALADMKNEAINSITFYTYNAIEASGSTVRISLGETTRTSFGTYVEGLTPVATISITPGVSQVVIDFDSPYPYGGGNLVVDATVMEVGECSLSADPFICGRLDVYCGLSRGEITKAIPMATFGYGADVPYAAKVLPTELAFNTIRAERTDVQTVTLKNVGNNPFTPAFSATSPFAVDVQASALAPNESMEVPVTFAPMVAGEFSGTLSIDCGGAGILTVPLMGSALEAGQDLTVCDSTAIGTLPIDGVYIDIVGTEGQMIYPAEMLTDMVGGKIQEVKFYPQRLKMNGGVVTLSLMTTDQMEYTEEVLLTGLTTVATATPVKGSEEFVFTLDEPFEYNGGNLVVDALVTEPGVENTESSTFYGVATEYWASLEAWNWYGYFVGFVGFLPKATFTYQKDAVEVWQLGDVNHDHSIDVGDVTALIGYILGNSAENFFITEANVDGDASSTIDVGDVTALIALILSN